MPDNHNIPDLAAYLLAHRNPDVSLANLADTLDRLTWILDEPAAELIESTRQVWLLSDDPLAVEVALLMDETFPCDTREELARQFLRITQKFPKLDSLCKKILKQWDTQPTEELRRLPTVFPRLTGVAHFHHPSQTLPPSHPPCDPKLLPVHHL